MKHEVKQKDTSSGCIELASTVEMNRDTVEMIET